MKHIDHNKCSVLFRTKNSSAGTCLSSKEFRPIPRECNSYKDPSNLLAPLRLPQAPEMQRQSVSNILASNQNSPACGSDPSHRLSAKTRQRPSSCQGFITAGLRTSHHPWRTTTGGVSRHSTALAPGWGWSVDPSQPLARSGLQLCEVSSLLTSCFSQVSQILLTRNFLLVVYIFDRPSTLRSSLMKAINF